MVNRNTTSPDSTDGYEPNFVDFGIDTLTVAATSLPSLLITVYISRYSDSDIPAASNTCLPCVAVVPIIADGIFARGKPLCEPFLAYPQRAATFAIRAPIEKFALAAWNPVPSALGLLPALPDLCWTEVAYTISASQ